MRIYKSIKKVIQELNPGVVVIDLLLNAGIDACYSLNREFVVSSPNNPLDLSRDRQPWLKGFWYYPTYDLPPRPGRETPSDFFSPFARTGAGVAFPVPWSDLPSNIMASVTLIWKMVMSPEITRLIKYRNAHGLPGWLPMASAPTCAAHIICPGIRETEFPLVMPSNLGLYGPIVLDTTPIEDVDPDLNRWLNRGKYIA